MTRAAKTDANHTEIVAALRQVGATVQSLAAVGQGVPDLMVAFRSNLHLLEIKDGTLPPSHRRLTPEQERWHSTWGSPVKVVKDVWEALEAIGA